MNEFELRRKLAALRQDRDPPRDLWPAIERTLAAGSQPTPAAHGSDRIRRWSPWAMAASILLAALLLWPHARPSVDPAHAALEHRATAHAAVERQADALRAEYRAALAQLATTPLPDDLQHAARELERNEQAIRDALRQHPESTYLIGQLRRTYEHQLRISQMAVFG